MTSDVGMENPLSEIRIDSGTSAMSARKGKSGEPAA
jgi:hypothetical protein